MASPDQLDNARRGLPGLVEQMYTRILLATQLLASKAGRAPLSAEAAAYNQLIDAADKFRAWAKDVEGQSIDETLTRHAQQIQTTPGQDRT